MRKIVIDNTVLHLCCDPFGNVFLKNNDKVYYLSIDNNNNIEGICVDYSNLHDVNIELKKHKINNTYGNNELRKKVIEKIEKDQDELNKELDFSDDEENIEYKNKYKYYPMNKYYYIENVENDDNEESWHDDDQIIFSQFDIDYIEKINKIIGSPPIYDFIIFDDIKKLVLCSIENKEKNSYQITLLHDDTFELNIIGDSKKLYKINITETNVYFELIKAINLL